MYDKEVQLKQGEIVYTLGGGLGSWAKSQERNIITGTVRCIGGKLMEAWLIDVPFLWGKDTIHWSPIEDNTPEAMRKWMNNL